MKTHYDFFQIPGQYLGVLCGSKDYKQNLTISNIYNDVNCIKCKNKLIKIFEERSIKHSL